MSQQILLVEDDPRLRKMWARILSQHGLEVTEAENGRAAMEHMLRKPANLVITDMVMPEMDGVETIVALRQSYPGVKIIAISEGGFGPAENCLKIANKLGAQKTFAKPLVLQQLLEAIRELLGQNSEAGGQIAPTKTPER
jgi:DNA-binding response OmpR family regulator